MANPAHVEKLCEGPKAWNEWRDANPNTIPDLTEIKLTLHQRQLGPSNGGPVDLRLVDMENATLPYATLSGADLEGARLIGADLTHARLDGAKLNGADLTDAVLDQADLTGAVLDQAVLFGAQLSNTRNLTSAQLEDAYGDASTRLPGNVMPPASWFPASEYDDDDYAGWGTPVYDEPEESLYEALGLTPEAGSEEIRSAYRTLVKKLHPDLNPDDAAAQERFKRVTTAYRILNDAAQRQRYDRGEIDGEGRVNPEFEARRRFRRAAFRYYAAAAGSFVLTAGLLAGVWHVVLSDNPFRSAPPEVAIVSQPKSSDRLGEMTVRPPKSEQSTPARTNAAPTAAEVPASESAQAKSVRETAVSETAAPETNAPQTTGAEQQVSAAVATSAPTPEQPASAESDNQPAEDQSRASPPPDQPATAAKTAAQPGPRAPQGENTRRPLQRPHKDIAGQAPQSAPERWLVAAFPQSEPDSAAPARADPRFPAMDGDSLSAWQRPAARDSVSAMLRDRALKQGQGKERRSLTASENAPVPQRRADVTSALPASGPASAGKPRTTPVKRAPVAQQQPRKPQTSRASSRTQATASNASVLFEEQ